MAHSSYAPAELAVDLRSCQDELQAERARRQQVERDLDLFARDVQALRGEVGRRY